MIYVYGIKNCNSMKKCFDYLTDKGVCYTFVDYKKTVVSREVFGQWATRFGLAKLINKQGTTYKKLSDEDKSLIAAALGAERAEGDALEAVYQLVAANQSLIKRPIVTGEPQGDEVALIGFDSAAFEAAFA